MASFKAVTGPIYEQIEKTATYLNQTTYATYLSFFQALQLHEDNLSGEFFPVSSVAQRSRNPKLFVVGVLPPAIDITGRILDRSMTIAREDPSLLTSPVTAPENQTPEIGASERALPAKMNVSAAGAHKWARPVLIEAFRKVKHRDPNLAELQYLHAVAWREGGYGLGWKDAMKGSNNWGAVQCPGGKAGPNCQPYQDTRPDGTKYWAYYRTYPTPVDGAADVVVNVFGRSRPQTAKALAEGGTVFDASYAMRRERYYEGFCYQATKKYGGTETRKSSLQPYLNEATRACAEEAITSRSKQAKETIDQVALANGDPSVMSLGTYAEAEARWRREVTGGGDVGADVEGGEDWTSEGSSNAQSASKQRAKTIGTPLNSTAFGKALTNRQKAQIDSTRLALEQMRQLPPLRMLVNPQKFSVKMSKLVNDGDFSRNGPIEEHFSDDQDKISASGQLAAFFAMDVHNSSSPGMTRSARNYSMSWQNFQALFLVYKNNAAMYLEDFAGVEGEKNLSMLGSVYIYYDNTFYIGSFDSFNFTESDTKPFSVDYSFEFSARATFLLDRTDDVLTYGAPQFFNRQQDVPMTSQEADEFLNQLIATGEGG